MIGGGFDGLRIRLFIFLLLYLFNATRCRRLIFFIPRISACADAQHAFTVDGAETQTYFCRDAAQKTKWLRVLRRAIASASQTTTATAAKGGTGAASKQGAAGGIDEVYTSDGEQEEGADSWQHGWLADVPQDLDVFMAQRCFEDAVDLLDKATLALDDLPP